VNTKPRGEADDYDVVIDSVKGSREVKQAKIPDFCDPMAFMR